MKTLLSSTSNDEITMYDVKNNDIQCDREKWKNLTTMRRLIIFEFGFLS